uniref:RBR-type E3 ubiquitin transferase n=1 Tax=Steinernema glaseri TaxID=37863 RepID=A0A1I8A827_9BILA
MSALKSIYENDEGVLEYSEDAISQLISGTLRVDLPRLATPLTVYLRTQTSEIKKYDFDFAGPVHVFFNLPEDYPSISPPIIKLKAVWLSAALNEKLMRKIDEICMESIGLGMLFFVMEAVIDETRDMKKFAGEIDLDGFDFNELEITPMNRLELIAHADHEGELREFHGTNYECHVCFENFLGKDCTRFLPCKHVFCCNCAANYFKTMLNENVKQIECMEDGCKSVASDCDLRKFFSEEEFERYQTILHRNTLESMGDVVICARESCQLPVVVERSDPASSSSYSMVAQCTKCRYSFCLLCRRVNHGIEPCRINANLEQVVEQYENGSEAEKKEFHRRYGGEKRFRMLVDQYKNEKWIQANSKKCPRCRFGIERSFGCNKMQCTKCNCNFCWLCLRILDSGNPYDHFAGGDLTATCVNRLFDGTEMEFDSESEDEFVDYDFVDSDEEDRNVILFMDGI